MLEKEYNFYKNNEKKLLKQFKGKFIVIIGEEIVGNYEGELEAIKYANSKYEEGTYLIQCVDDEDKLTQRYHSRVYV